MKRASPFFPAAVALVAALALAGCNSSSAKAAPDGTVFADNFGSGLNPARFDTSPPTATITPSTAEHHTGSASLEVVVPAGSYSGWAFPTGTPRDLSSFNALTFWAKATVAGPIDVIGFGNDNTGTSPYTVDATGLELTTAWTRYVIPIPDPSKLTAEKGLFHFAIANGPRTVWFDDVRFESVAPSEIGAPAPKLGDGSTQSLALEVGANQSAPAATVTFTVAGAPVVEKVDRRWFTWTSSNTAAATVSTAGSVHGVAIGSANVTATLGTTPVAGSLGVTVGPVFAPATAAPAPAAAAANVISLYSNAYTNVPVDTWRTDWSSAGALEDVTIAGGDVKKYNALVFAGVEFKGANAIDATAMTHLHVDVWSHAATLFKVKLVDFGADNAFGGGDDKEQELVFNAGSSPAYTPDGWSSLDIPLAAFTGLATRAHLSQLIFSADTATVWIDNVYFEKVAAPPPQTSAIFADDFAAGLAYVPFGGSIGAPSVDPAVAHAGTASMKIDVPATGYTGGALVASSAQDVSGFDAITFWAKASKATATLNVVGTGNNGAGDTTFQVERAALALTDAWTQFVLPLPRPALLTAQTALFHFAEGSDEGAYTIWIDDLQFAQVGAALGTPVPAIATETLGVQVGATVVVNGASLAYPAGYVATVARRYFDWTSSAPQFATVSADGVVTGVAAGQTLITAKLGAVDAAGTTTVNVTPAAVPTVAAPTPSLAAADVISLFSDAYTNVPVDTWRTSWSGAGALEDVTIAGDAAKKYNALVFAGIETVGPNSVNATAMTHFHIDAWTADATVFKVKLVDFGADNAFGGGDDAEHELVFDASSTPALVTGQWQSFDLPLSSFTNLTTRSHISQLIISSSTTAVWIDNVYFHK